MKRRIVLTIIVLCFFMGLLKFGTLVIWPSVSMDIGVAQLEDSEYPFYQQQTYHWLKGIVPIVITIIGIFILYLIWFKKGRTL